MSAPSALPTSVDATLDLLTRQGYLAERALATVTYLSLRMGRPLFLEGEAGVGKTEIVDNQSLRGAFARDRQGAVGGARPLADPPAVL